MNNKKTLLSVALSCLLYSGLSYADTSKGQNLISVKPLDTQASKNADYSKTFPNIRSDINNNSLKNSTATILFTEIAMEHKLSGNLYSWDNKQAEALTMGRR